MCARMLMCAHLVLAVLYVFYICVGRPALARAVARVIPRDPVLASAGPRWPVLGGPREPAARVTRAGPPRLARMIPRDPACGHMMARVVA